MLTARELAVEVGVCHKTMLHILHGILGCRKVAGRWLLLEFSEVQQWNRYAVAQAFLNLQQREGDDFLGRIVAMDVTWVRTYEQNLKRHWNELKHPGSPRPRKVCPTQYAVKGDVQSRFFFFGFSHKCEMCLKVVGGNNYIFYVIYKWKKDCNFIANFSNISTFLGNSKYSR